MTPGWTSPTLSTSPPAGEPSGSSPSIGNSPPWRQGSDAGRGSRSSAENSGLRVHPLERLVEVAARGVAGLLREAVGDLHVAAQQAGHHRVGKLVERHAEGVQAGTAQVRVD